MNEPKELTTKEKLLLETARMRWHDLQVFFARGVVLNVDSSLDLLTVATAVAQNDVELVADWQKESMVAAPDNRLARDWYQEDKILWSVVVAPFVLVQDKTHK